MEKFVTDGSGLIVRVYEGDEPHETYFSGTVVESKNTRYSVGYFSSNWVKSRFRPYEPAKPKEVVLARTFWDRNKLMGEPLIEASELADVFYRDGKLIGVLKCSVG